METSDKEKTISLALNHSLTVDTGMALHKICSDIAYELGISDMHEIFALVTKTLYSSACNMQENEDTERI